MIVIVNMKGKDPWRVDSFGLLDLFIAVMIINIILEMKNDLHYQQEEEKDVHDLSKGYNKKKKIDSINPSEDLFDRINHKQWIKIL